ncbi:MAG TPA: LysR family transcriptional regulator [Candidatus Binatia bacterium]|nr:LysR family transcriptional regulator [Candidatus Binatia bacterium]
MELNLVHLRTLREIARRESFSRAADALHLTQPAVSLHIRQLEDAVGLPVLERVGKRAFPTRAGEILIEHGARALGELAAAADAVQRLRGVVAGRIRLGSGATASIHLLPPLLRRLRARYPELELIVVTGNAPDMARAVVNNALDVAIVTLPVAPRHLVVSSVLRDPLLAIAPPQAAWRRRRRPVTADELARHPLMLYEPGGTIRKVIDAWFQRAGAAPRVAMELGNEEAIKKLVGAGLGLSIIPAIATRTEAKSGALVALRLDPPLARRLGVVRRKDKPMSPALEVFLSALAEFLRDAGR